MKPFLIAVTLCGVAAALLAPPAVSLVALFLVLYVIPGIVIVSFTCPQKDAVDLIILSVLTGVAFHIVYAYILSVGFHFSFLSLFLPSIFLAVFFDIKGRWNLHLDKKTLLIFLPALLFGVATYNLVPGEDANFHLLALNDITAIEAVPHTYTLYPEIPTIMYPLGFHVLTAQLQLLSGVDNLMFGVASLLSAVLCLSVYWCTKNLFSIKCGLLAGTLSVFAVLPPVNSMIQSTYANLLAYIFTCAAIGIIAHLLNNKNDLNPFILLSLILAAGIETHLSFFLILIPIFIFFVEGFLKKGAFRENIKYLLVLGLSVIFALPFLVRISAGYNLYEVGRFLSLWYDPLQFTPQMIPERVGVWITLISIPGFFLLKKHKIFFGAWIGVFLFLAVNTVIRIEFPLWYVFFATRMVDQLFLPFSILGAFFLTRVWKFSAVGVVLLCGILLLSGSSHVIKAPRADRGVLFPTISPFFAEDQEGMAWLMNTQEDTVVLNEWWTAVGSAWIPSLAERRVIFPYIFSLEHYVEVLDLPKKEQQRFVIAAFPDSEEAHARLKEWGVDYVFLSSYVLEESKWRNALWNPFVLMKSPNYDLVFQKGYTYIFEVASQFEYTTTFDLVEFGVFTAPPDNPVTLNVSLGSMSFPVEKILDIYLEDEKWGDIKIKAGETLLAVIPQIDAGYNVHVACRIPENVNEVTISVEDQPVRMSASVSAAFHDSIPYYYNIVLVGESWEKVKQGHELKEQGHIYVFNVSGALELTYIDTGEGNVDFNLFIDGEWQKLTTVYRENDGEIKTILLEIPEGYTLLDIGINNWGDPFVVVGFRNAE